MPKTATTPTQIIASLEEPQRGEVKQLHALIRKTLPKFAPTVEKGMIVYGTYHYKYPSGREGDWYRVALASRKTGITVYVCVVDERGYVAEQAKARLGKASVGKSCIRFKRLAGVKLDVLAEVVAKAKKHPAMGEVKEKKRSK